MKFNLVLLAVPLAIGACVGCVSPALRLLCAAVSALCTLVFDGGLRFSTFLC